MSGTEKARRAVRSEETLSHFSCPSCGKWWSIGDAPPSKHAWFCPWCGKKNTFATAKTEESGKDYFAYLIECADGTLYAGSTTDLERRVEEHNGSKKGAKYTKVRRPVTLRFAERFPTWGEALSREAALKKLSRKEKLALGRKVAPHRKIK